MLGQSKKVDYKPISPDPKKSCLNCKHFNPTDGGMGECFGHKVAETGTCNYFEQKVKVTNRDK